MAYLCETCGQSAGGGVQPAGAAAAGGEGWERVGKCGLAFTIKILEVASTRQHHGEHLSFGLVPADWVMCACWPFVHRAINCPGPFRPPSHGCLGCGSWAWATTALPERKSLGPREKGKGGKGARSRACCIASGPTTTPVPVMIPTINLCSIPATIHLHKVIPTFSFVQHNGYDCPPYSDLHMLTCAACRLKMTFLLVFPTCSLVQHSGYNWKHVHATAAGADKQPDHR